MYNTKGISCYEEHGAKGRAPVFIYSTLYVFIVFVLSRFMAVNSLTEPVIHNFFWLWWDLPVGSTKIKKILGKWLTPERCVCGQGVVSYSTLDFMCWHFETNVSGCRLPAVKICPGHVTEANWNGNTLPSRKGASTTLIQENQNCLWGSHRKNACNVIWWTSCIRWVCRLCA